MDAAALFVVVLGLGVLGFGFFILDRHASGPAYNAGSAERSFAAALARKHPDAAAFTVHCDGLRDGSHFFSCSLTPSQSGLPNSADLSYSDSSHRYTADTGGGPQATAPMTFSVTH